MGSVSLGEISPHPPGAHHPDPREPSETDVRPDLSQASDEADQRILSLQVDQLTLAGKTI